MKKHKTCSICHREMSVVVEEGVVYRLCPYCDTFSSYGWIIHQNQLVPVEPYKA